MFRNIGYLVTAIFVIIGIFVMWHPLYDYNTYLETVTDNYTDNSTTFVCSDGNVTSYNNVEAFFINNSFFFVAGLILVVTILSGRNEHDDA